MRFCSRAAANGAPSDEDAGDAALLQVLFFSLAMNSSELCWIVLLAQALLCGASYGLAPWWLLENVGKGLMAVCSPSFFASTLLCTACCCLYVALLYTYARAHKVPALVSV